MPMNYEQEGKPEPQETPPVVDETLETPAPEGAPETPAPEAEAAPEPTLETQPEPAETREPAVVGRGSPQQQSVPDDLDGEFDHAIKAIDEDEVLSPGQKAVEKLKIKTARDDRKRTLQRDSIDAEERARNTDARALGVTREIFDSTWEQACTDSEKQLGYKSADGARLLFKQKIAAMKAQKKPNNSAAAKGPQQTRDTAGKFAGSQIAPPTGRSAGQAGGKKPSADEKFDREIDRIFSTK